MYAMPLPKTLLENKEIQNICKIIGLVLTSTPFYQYQIWYILLWQIKTTMDPTLKDCSSISSTTSGQHCYNKRFHPNLPHRRLTKWRGNNVRQYYSIPEFEQAKQNKDFPDNATIKYYKGLGTSTPAEAKEYFRNIHQHRSSIAYTGPQDRDALDMAFRKTRANDRRKWLTSIDPRAGLINPTTYKEFVDLELILFSNADNDRSIASVLDGLGPHTINAYGQHSNANSTRK